MKMLTCVMLVMSMVLLGGCGTLGRSAPEPTVVVESPQKAYAAAIATCAEEISKIATNAAGDAASKVAAVGAIERLCGASGREMVASMQPQAVAPPATFGQMLWQGALAVADVALRGYGIRTTRDVAITQSNNATAAQISGNNTIASLGGAIGTTASNVAGAGFGAVTALANKPVVPTTSITISGGGTNNIGSGTLSIDNSNRSTATTTTTTTTTNPTRQCTAGTVC